jgi:hypothetical protein
MAGSVAIARALPAGKEREELLLAALETAIRMVGVK